MNRRGFLGKVLAGFAAVLGIKPVVAVAKTEDVFLPVVAPLSVFTPIKFEDGQTPEFPKDFILNAGHRTTAWFLAPSGPVEDKNQLDWVYVPICLFGNAGDTEAEARQRYRDRLEKHARQLLLVAAQNNKELPTGTYSDLRRSIREHFGEGGIYYIEEDGWLIGVHHAKAEDTLIMPYKHDFLCFEDPAHFGNRNVPRYYGYGEVGLAVLDDSVVVCGRIKS